ncbi:MAG: hypothetical protein QXI42_02295 [Thermoproteota archaeon]
MGEMNKVKVEWWEGGVLKYVEAKPKATQKGNLKIEALGKIMVFETLNHECDVVSPEGGKWVKIGRVTRFREIVLGDGMSSSEVEEFKHSRERRNIRLCPECNSEFRPSLEYGMVLDPIRKLDASMKTVGFLTERCDVCGSEAPCFKYVGARVKQVQEALARW